MSIQGPLQRSLQRSLQQNLQGAMNALDLSLYYFYTNLAFLDRVSKQPLTSITTGDHYGYDGGVFGDNEAVIEGGKLLTAGGYTQLIKMSEDISDGAWIPVLGGISAQNIFQASSINGRVVQTLTTTGSAWYNLQFTASVESGGQLTNYAFSHANSETGTYTLVALTETPTVYSLPILGASGGGAVDFGFRDRNSSNWAEVTITNFQVTQSPYPLPYVPNHTTDPIVVPHSYSDDDEGFKYPIGSALPDIDNVDAWEVVGEELVTNGDDWTGATGSTPPTGWTAGSAIYTIVADGGVTGIGDAALKVEVDSVGNPNVRIGFSTEIGASYLFNSYHKHGDSTKGVIRIGSTSAQDDLLTFDNLVDATWTQQTGTFTAITTTTWVTLLPISSTIGKYELFDNVSVKQIQPTTAWQTCGSNLLDAFDGVADGVELVTNGEFTNWTGDDPDGFIVSEVGDATSNITQNGNACRIISDGATAFLSQTGVLEVGKTYRYSIKLTNTTSGVIYMVNPDGNGDISFSNTQTYTASFTSNTTLFRIKRGTGCDITFTDLSVKQISTAQGRLTFPWTPKFNAADVTGQISILTANDTAVALPYYDADTEELKAFDGVNTAVVACTPVNGTTYDVALDYGPTDLGNKMQLTVNETTGDKSDFEGSFPVTDNMSIAWHAEAPQYVGRIKTAKEPVWEIP